MGSEGICCQRTSHKGQYVATVCRRRKTSTSHVVDGGLWPTPIHNPPGSLASRPVQKGQEQVMGGLWCVYI